MRWVLGECPTPPLELELRDTGVSHKYVPPFATLALVQNAGGGAYTQDVIISLVITPSLLGMKSLSVGGGGQARGVAEREAERCS